MNAAPAFPGAIEWGAAAASIRGATGAEVARALAKDRLSPADLPALLAPAADTAIEAMARRARALTLQRFGRAVALYAPLYISSVCINSCRYCGGRWRRSTPTTSP